MPYGSGLSAQYGMLTETTVGTEVTVTRFYEFLNESLQFVPTWLDSAGLKAGQAFKRVARTAQSRFDVNGDITLEHTDGAVASAGASMGLWWRHALGSSVTTATQIAATTAYKQIHTPGNRTGLSFTAQVGRPQTDGTVRAFSYRGCKIRSWEFSCSDGQLAQLKLTLDAWNEATATALAAASYPSPNSIFSFADATNFKIGGTASTAAGETTVSGGVAMTTVCKGITLTGDVPLATDRYGLGNAGVKREQIENGIPTITGELDAEFTSRTEIYDLLKANTTTTLQLDFSHGDAGSGNPFLLSFIMPAVKIKTGAMNADGPDILQQKIGFEAFDDGSGTNPVIQVKLVSKEQGPL